jgi:D-alanine transaminase
VAMRDHVMPADLEPTVFAMVNRLYIYTEQERSQGVACFTADDFRWKKAHIKTTSLAAAVLSRQISADEGGNETIMFRDGSLSEAAASNVWVVKDGVVLGPPRDNLVLEGIRYGLLEELCRADGIPFELRRVSRAEVLAADEIILSSATKEVLPCTRLDGRPVGNGTPGPIYRKLFAGYQRAKRSQP